jgi:hypothetical protein
VLGVRIVNQFGATVVDVIKPDRLLVPSAKDLDAPPALPAAFGVDHFKCYKVRVSKGEGRFSKVYGVTVADQFGTATVRLVKPFRLCVPVDKDGESPGSEDHPDDLLCYKTKDGVAPTVTAHVANQLASQSLQLKRFAELCVPSSQNPRSEPCMDVAPCRKPSGEACVPPAGATVLGPPSNVPSGTDACCCNCADVSTGAACIPDDSVCDGGSCVCASECARPFSPPPSPPAPDSWFVGLIPCDALGVLTVEGGCAGQREVLYLPGLEESEQQGQPSEVCEHNGLRLANKVVYLRNVRTGMADTGSAPITLCPFDAAGNEITENMLRASASLFTLVAPRVSYPDLSFADAGCDTCAQACMAAVCTGTGDISGVPGCPGPDGLFGTSDDGISSCDLGSASASFAPGDDCYEGACGRHPGSDSLSCSRTNECECGGWFEPCCSAGSACESGLACVGSSPGFCGACGGEGMPCCGAGACGASPILASIGPHAVGVGESPTPEGVLFPLFCDASAGTPGVCRSCGLRYLECCGGTACASGLTCNAGWCVDNPALVGLCVQL